MHALPETPSGFALMGSDTPAGMSRPDASNISIGLSGDEFGMCVGPYGVAWMVDIGQGAAG